VRVFGSGGAVVDQDGAQPAVAADDVAGAGGAAADRIAGTAGDFDARQLVPQRSSAGGIEADEVALDQVVAPEDADTAQGVAGDQIAGAGPWRKGAADSFLALSFTDGPYSLNVVKDANGKVLRRATLDYRYYRETGVDPGYNGHALIISPGKPAVKF